MSRSAQHLKLRPVLLVNAVTTASSRSLHNVISAWNIAQTRCCYDHLHRKHTARVGFTRFSTTDTRRMSPLNAFADGVFTKQPFYMY